MTHKQTSKKTKTSEKAPPRFPATHIGDPTPATGPFGPRTTRPSVHTGIRKETKAKRI